MINLCEELNDVKTTFTMKFQIGLDKVEGQFMEAAMVHLTHVAHVNLSCEINI